MRRDTIPASSGRWRCSLLFFSRRPVFFFRDSEAASRTVVWVLPPFFPLPVGVTAKSFVINFFVSRNGRFGTHLGAEDSMVKGHYSWISPQRGWMRSPPNNPNISCDFCWKSCENIFTLNIRCEREYIYFSKGLQKIPQKTMTKICRQSILRPFNIKTNNI